MSVKPFSQADLQTNDKVYIVIDSFVYDVTKFAMMHPGGRKILTDMAGKDVTEEFYALHKHEILRKYKNLRVGRLEGAEQRYVDPDTNQFAEISKVPYAEHAFFTGVDSPYYKESHKQFQKALRAYVSKELQPKAFQMERAGQHPSKEFYQAMGDAGVLACRLGAGKPLVDAERILGKKPGELIPAGIKASEYDYFHSSVYAQELGRIGAHAFSDGIGGGLTIGIGPVMKFWGNKAGREKVGREVLSGEKRICLAISEAWAGSNVASIKTTAVKSADGTKFIVNGTKKWITGGVFADYFTTAVVTDPEAGAGGISLLLIERSKGVATKQMKTSYSSTAGTAYITFEDVEVPVENLIGRGNDGWMMINANFVHERFAMVLSLIGQLRAVIEDCWLWSMQREVFGKKLIKQPVIRLKLANMISAVQGISHWADAVTYQMTLKSYIEQAKDLGADVALLKYAATRTSHMIADEAVQILGGRGITQTGFGERVEALQRTQKFSAILGGSEEILADLAIRHTMRSMPAKARL